MFVIDLTPDDLKVSQVRHTRLRLWIAVLAALMAGILCIAAFYFFQWKKENNTLQSLQQELQTVQSRINVLSQTQNQLELWRDRIAVLAQLGLYPEYAHILNSLQTWTPQSVYVSKLEFIHPEKTGSGASSDPTSVAASLPKSAQMFLLKDPSSASPGKTPADPAIRSIQMKILGKAIDHESVAAYLHTLQSSGCFRPVRLIHSTRQTVNQDAMIDFEIHCTLVPMGSLQESKP